MGTVVELELKDKLAVGQASNVYPGPFYEERHFMQHYYGKALHKVPVDFNYGCPHRTPEHHGGCTFCPEDGSRATQIDGIDELSAQIEAAVAFAQHRYGATGFTAYVQAYTATFAPVSKFREQMKEILTEFPFDALHLGTRPDCLPASTLDYLKDLSQTIDLWVELGLQSVHDKTLKRIVREHDWACSVKGVEKLKAKGLQVISHVILGLPGETREDMLETARVMAQLPIDGIKIHNLHVLEKTQLADEYRAQPFHLLSELEYMELLAEFLRYLPPHLPVMRINTDTPPKELVAPHWKVQKGQMREFLIQHMDRMGYRQGDHFSEADQSPRSLREPKLSTTMDGSFTLLSEKTGEPFNPRYGSETSLRERFLEPSQLKQRLEQADVQLIDIGFGTGTLSRMCLEVESEVKKGQLSIHGFEQHRRATLLSQAHQPRWFADIIKRADVSFESRQSPSLDEKCNLSFGDARWHLQSLNPGSADLIFLDPFDEKNNAELVTVEFFSMLKHMLKQDGVLLVSRTHDAILKGLILAGFVVERNKGVVLAKVDLGSKLNESDLNEPNLEKVLPYRDPHLCWGHKDIVRQRSKALAKT